MPMNWTPEKNTKLFLGVLEQAREQNLKLNHRRLAEYMGPDCTWKAIEGQIAKLKKQASQDPNETSASTSVSGAGSAPSTPAATPKKRGASGTPAKTGGAGSPQKRKKKEAKIEQDDSDDDSEEEKMALWEVKQELKELNE
ncbi:hypothetical protein BJY01DRAFT_242783 [Aspergillus pseudoustus]|uniref:Uncharacterized protein n=1 Tax=Aspergillus pseudoustus TaxID=1810923 RepID=A0ABR4KVY4_9EURO